MSVAWMRTWALAIGLAACGGGTPAPVAPTEVAAPADDAIRLEDGVTVRAIAEGVWLVTTARAGAPSANAVLVERATDSFLVDTGWSAAQLQRVLAWARDVRARPIAVAMITTGDEDRVGGASALIEAGVPVHASGEAIARCAARGAPIDARPLEPSTIPELHVMLVRIAPYPEAMVAYHGASRTVFGGRFVDALDAARPSRDGDGDLSGWRAALDLIPLSYPDAVLVVPGFGAPGTLALVAHTRMLLAECRADAECAVTIEEFHTCDCCRCREPRAMTPAAMELAREGQPSCQPICDDVQCMPCATPEELARLRAVCDRGECALAPAP